MRTFYSHWILCILASLLLLSGCGPAPSATPQPAATPVPATTTPAPPTDTPIPPTVPPQPTTTPTVEPSATSVPDASLPADWVAFADETRGLVIYHPAAWDVTQPTAANLTALFEEAEGSVASESIQAILGQLTETPGALDLFAGLGFLFDDPSVATHRFVSNFTAIVVPAEGLTLDAYVDLVGAQLSNLDSFAVQSAQVEGGLRPGGLDVASLRYSMDGSVLYNLPDGPPINGWQVALYDTGAERLLILSLTGIGENFPALEEMFRVLIANVEFE